MSVTSLTKDSLNLVTSVNMKILSLMWSLKCAMMNSSNIVHSLDIIERTLRKSLMFPMWVIKDSLKKVLYGNTRESILKNPSTVILVIKNLHTVVVSLRINERTLEKDLVRTMSAIKSSLLKVR